LTGGATIDALAVGADLAGVAFGGAFTAVVEIIGDIDANTGAISKSSGADAFAGGAELTAGAFSTAGAAVIGVVGQIDA
jgi:hypothetical protein